MRVSLNDIKKPIETELEKFELLFRQSMKSQVPLLDTIMTYIVKRKGKQVRPMFVMFCARLFEGITPATYRGAALVELLHTATLVHDDVVDDSNLRRGFFSVYALWKGKVSVLVGDYLLSKGLQLSIENNDFELLRIVNEAVRMMSEGELLQIEKARRLDISEEIYFQIITQKTASLIASCCAIGASSAGASKEETENMRLFGEKIGIAFQIKDDLFDYGDSTIGKPTGIDIKEKKLTLPLIYALSHASREEKKRIIYLIKNKNTEPRAVKEVIDFVVKSGGLDYAREKMLSYKEDAIALINDKSGTESYKSIVQLVDFVIERSN